MATKKSVYRAVHKYPVMHRDGTVFTNDTEQMHEVDTWIEYQLERGILIDVLNQPEPEVDPKTLSKSDTSDAPVKPQTKVATKAVEK